MSVSELVSFSAENEKYSFGLYTRDTQKYNQKVHEGYPTHYKIIATPISKPFQRCSFRYRLTGYFLSQPIPTLENISYIFLAQADLKTQVYMENYNLLQHNKLAL